MCRLFEIPITNTTTCGDVIGELKAMLDLSTGLNEYGLFVRVGTKADVRMDDEIIVHAVMIHVESGLYDGKESVPNKDGGDDTASSEPTTVCSPPHPFCVFWCCVFCSSPPHL